MATNRTTRLRLETLDERALPSVLNLTSPGATAAGSQFIVRQSAADDQSDFTKFVSLKGWGADQGYNTTANHTQFDEDRGPGVKSALKLADVPVVTVNGTTYREFVLDVKQPSWSPLVSLDEVSIFVGNSSKFSGYNAHTNKMNGKTPVFDLDAGGNKSVLLNANLNAGSGYGDMTLLVKDSVFANAGANAYVSLYSQFSGAFGGWWGGWCGWGNNGSESWSVRKDNPPVSEPPPAPANTASLSGSVFVDAFQDGVFDPENLTGTGGDVPIDGVTVQLFLQNASGSYDLVATTTTVGGCYSFTNLAEGVYQVVVTPAESVTVTDEFGSTTYSLADGPAFAGSLGGTVDLDLVSGITVGSGQQGTGYQFTASISG